MQSWKTMSTASTMESSTEPVASSSRIEQAKPKAPHPSTAAYRARVSRLAPPAPARPSSSSHPATKSNGTHATLPIKTLQGVKTRRTDSTKDGWDRDVVFVTRNSPLGALMGRCRSLIMDEGYTRIRLHALAAAIPHALLLLHALLDILPYPQGDRGMWYEIRTGSTECIDEVRKAGKGKGKAIADATAEGGGDISMVSEAQAKDDEFGDIGAVEEDEPERISRLKASIEIDLHIGPKRKRTDADPAIPQKKAPPTIAAKRTRPSKRKREHLKRIGQNKGTKEQHDDEDEDGDEGDEEAAMNAMMGLAGPQTSKDNRKAGKGVASKKTRDGLHSHELTTMGRPKHVAVMSQEEEEEEYENM